MTTDNGMRDRITSAWLGRISGCMLGKPVEGIGTSGRMAVRDYLDAASAHPLRDYVPYIENAAPGISLGDVELPGVARSSCRGEFDHALVDDDINYSVLALMLLEAHGADLTTADVARSWLRHLPAGATFTAEIAAYTTMLAKGNPWFAVGADPGFDLADCADNEYNDWIGAQIRADVYGWACPGNPELAARLCRADAELSHRGDGVECAVAVAAIGASIPVTDSFSAAIDLGLEQVGADSGARRAATFGRSVVGDPDAIDKLHAEFGHLHPVHAVNNHAVVIWALLEGEDDFSTAIGEAVTAGWDTDCNGATVGGLWGLSGRPIPAAWTDPWQGRVTTAIAGASDLDVADLAERTVRVAQQLARTE